MATLQVYENILLVMQDGRILIGILAGWDQKSNIVLSDCIERRFSMEEGVEETPLGLYLVKGDQICTLGEIDQALDEKTPWSEIRAEPLPHIRH